MKQEQFLHEHQRFSIRKYSFGAASVLLGTSLFLAGHAQAAEQEPVSSTIDTASVFVTDAGNLASSELASLASLEQASANSEVSSHSDAVGDSQVQANTLDSQSLSLVSISSVSETSTLAVANSSSVAASEFATSEQAPATDVRPSESAEAQVAPQVGTTRFFSVGEVATRQPSSQLPSSGTYVYKKRTELKNEPKLSAPTQFFVNAGDSVYYDQVVTADGYQWISYKSYSGVRRYAPVLPAVSGSGKPKEEKVASSPVADGALAIPDKGTFVFQRNTDIKTEPKADLKPTFVFSKGDHVIYDKVLKADGHQWISYLGYDYNRYYADVATLSVSRPNESEKPEAPQTSPSSQATTTVIGGENVPASGRYQVTRTLNVKNEPKASAPTEFTLENGYTLNYDKVLTADNHQWLSYVSFSGTRRYVDIATLKTVENKPTEAKPVDPKPSGKVAIVNQTSDGFDVLITNVSSDKAIQEVAVPVWSVKGGQDDLKWYTANKQTDGTYKTHVEVSEHKGDYGDYLIHLYYKIDGKNNFVTAVKTTLAQPESTNNGKAYNLPEAGNYTFTKTSVVKNSAKLSATTEFTFEKGDVLTYDKVLVADGHQWLSYVSYSGTRRYVDIATLSPEAQKLTGKLTIDKQDNGEFTVTVSHIPEVNGLQGVEIPVWTAKNGQDDIVWHKAEKQVDGSYKVKVSPSQHKDERGDYFVHAYYLIEGKKVFVDATKVTLPQPNPITGTLSIQGKSGSGFDVVISQVFGGGDPIQEVRVPVWSVKGGQDDLKWYTANKQADGTYKVHVPISNHKGDYGDYFAHLYYKIAGKSIFVNAIKTSVQQEEKLAGNIQVSNLSSDGFDVIISNITSAGKTIQEVVVPVWSVKDNQDDLKWYSADKQADGTYKTHVAVSDHKGDHGEYLVHLYYKIAGKLEGVAATSTTVPEPQAVKHELTHNGSYYSVRGKYDDIIIVNKKHGLSANYNPGENAEAKSAFTRLRDDMIRQGFNVGRSYSGFRTYAYQKTLYDNYVSRDGQAAADRYSARPGFSEHQTGLAFDLTDKSGNLLEDARASQWLKDHAHDYGFIVRYQAGKEASTGYMPEAWHIRYIGQEAKDIHDSGLSLEEYFGLEGGSYFDVTKPESTDNQANTSNLPASGRYTFTGRSSIKAEPKVSSPELAYYDTGMSVNYDKVVKADGHTWLSYLSQSGARRYVAISASASEPSSSNQVSSPELPASGRYNFTSRASIKAEPKASSPELAYYDAGMSVNYDKVVKADGHTWLSYLTFSGLRRYVLVA